MSFIIEHMLAPSLFSNDQTQEDFSMNYLRRYEYKGFRDSINGENIHW